MQLPKIPVYKCATINIVARAKHSLPKSEFYVRDANSEPSSENTIAKQSFLDILPEREENKRFGAHNKDTLYWHRNRIMGTFVMDFMS